jgi:hypothetical protein
MKKRHNHLKSPGICCLFVNVKILFTGATLQLIMEYTSGSSSAGSSSPGSSSSGSSEEPQDYFHEHPLLSYYIWERDQWRLQKTSSRKHYIPSINEHSITSASSLFKISTDKNCDCFVFRKAGKCFHVLRFVNLAEFRGIIKPQPDCPVRSMLYFPIDDMSSVLEEIMFIDQNNDGNLSNLVRCPKCNTFLNESLTLESHQSQCFPEMTDTKRSWRCKLPFLCEDLETYIDVDAIMLRPNELHHIIPWMMEVYDFLDKLNIRTSLIQILAQDPQYQKTLDILESQNMSGICFPYHLFLYILHRLLPFLEETLWYEDRDVHAKAIPIFTVIRSENGESSKDVTGFNEEEEIDKRLATCPDRYKSKVQELLASFSQENDDDGTRVEEYMKNVIGDGILTSSRTEWFYVLRCLDVKSSVYKGIRRFIEQRKGEDGDTWSTAHDFVYGKQDTEIGSCLTNIFGVLPRHRINGNPLKKALLFSKEKYNYDLHMACKLLCFGLRFHDSI